MLIAARRRPTRVPRHLWLLILCLTDCGSGSVELVDAASTTGGAALGPCPGAVSIPQNTGEPSGFVQCADGFIHHAESVSCSEPTPPSDCENPSELSTCTTDSDCTDAPFGSCGAPDFWPNADICECHYGCATDADCGPGYVCACSGVVGERARCVTSDCGEGCGDGLCGLYKREDSCGPWYARLACLTEASECRIDVDCQEVPDDCESGGFKDLDACVIKDAAWQCGIRGCGPCG